MDFTDQFNRNISIDFPPKRIISLVPSQTELLFDLGLSEEVVGITKFCVHPKHKFKSTVKIGGTKKLDIAKIRALNPDLIIGNKEENQKEDMELLMQEFPVWMSDIYNLDDALEMIKQIGKVVGRKELAQEIAGTIRLNFNILLKEIDQTPLKSVAYFIWHQPDMLAGKQTFIDEMLIYCTCKNVIDLSRYPDLSLQELMDLKPDVVFLSSEPYPFAEKHVAYFKNVWPNAKVELVDGEMFSWYGSRLLKSTAYFKQIKAKLF
nr:helical backbone metal receptor [uncultured Pedobacter sp.]